MWRYDPNAQEEMSNVEIRPQMPGDTTPNAIMERKEEMSNVEIRPQMRPKCDNPRGAGANLSVDSGSGMSDPKCLSNALRPQMPWW